MMTGKKRASVPETSIPEGDGVERSAGRRASLNPHTRDLIATRLRAMYDAVVQQPVPDRFADLVAKLESGEQADG